MEIINWTDLFAVEPKLVNDRRYSIKFAFRLQTESRENFNQNFQNRILDKGKQSKFRFVDEVQSVDHDSQQQLHLH